MPPVPHMLHATEPDIELVNSAPALHSAKEPLPVIHCPQKEPALSKFPSAPLPSPRSDSICAAESFVFSRKISAQEPHATGMPYVPHAARHGA